MSATSKSRAMMVAQRNNATGSSPEDPTPGITAGGQHNAFITTLCMPAGGPEARAVPASEGLGTVLTREHRAAASAVLFGTGGSGYAAKPVPVDQNGKTVVTNDRRALGVPVCAEYYGNGQAREASESLGCVPTVDRHGVGTPIVVPNLTPGMHQRALRVGRLLKRVLGERITLNAEGYAVARLEGVTYIIVDILFRMLKALELAAAMGFPSDYIWPTNQRATVQLIGNAVSCYQAEALIRAVFPRGRTTDAGKVRAA